MGFRDSRRAFGANQVRGFAKHLEPGDFLLVDNPTLVNSAIRHLSWSTYGHAILYLGPLSARGQHQAMEMPYKLGALADFLWDEDTTRVMGVHCHRLGKADRVKIVLTALKYAEAASKGRVRYDPTVILQAMGTVVTSPIHAVLGNASHASQGALAGATYIAESYGDAASLAGRVSAWAKDWKYLPNLSCAALVTYMHWSGAGYRTLGRGSNPAYAQPKELEARVRATPHHFKKAFEVKFGH